ncbi:MAG: pyridoxal-phosphate dependent enzyme [Maritimibacter sp.]|uniref:pyridoxal-phosphate dependent enzyme n=1 Tax=Maritimibacter sp. TaxID=2003363 RepID=UPI001D3AD23E|nr:pyridoxal-phosphate dependent enzyme [Maritimibacter sp.]MBL6426315.1 pyridoxal-phosphate dependent enzyme [Maritimibacter sp.]
MRAVRNPYRGAGLDHPALADIPFPLDDADPALARVARCPRHRITPLLPSADLADAAGVARVFVKDERARMGLGSFKALGAAHVIACDAAEGRAAGRTYVAASAGNHGLSVAAGAAAFGATSRIYLADTVPESFAERLRAEGAEVRRAGATYEESMATAEAEAADEGLTLLSDSSWPGYTEMPRTLMEGYLILMAEAASQLPESPSHILLQAGVGGLAGAAAAHARRIWGDDPVILVVEPEAAPALIGSIEAGAPTESQGPVSIMGRLDCKMPSLIALKGLARDADWFVTITESEAQAGCDLVEAAGLPSTPSGAAGLAALVAGLPDEVGTTQKASILTILSETA